MHKLIAVEFNGGCGNQLFQVAMGYSFSKKFSRRLVADIRGCDSSGSFHGSFHISAVLEHLSIESVRRYRTPREIFVNRAKEFANFSKRIMRSDIIEHYNQTGLPGRNLTLSGYEDGFFVKEAERLGFVDELQTFKANYLSNRRFCTSAGEFIDTGSCRDFVGVHLRGTDVRVEDRFLPVSRYRSVLDQNFKGERFLIFSDDANLVEEFRQVVPNAIWIHEPTDPLSEVLLASECKALVLSNSTFSFWISTLSHASTIFSPVEKSSIFAPLRNYVKF